VQANILLLKGLVVSAPISELGHVRPGAGWPSGYPSSSAANAGADNNVVNNDVTARTVNTERKVIFITN
jgi:hypothetical protein